jgi:hypothetical protein
MHHFFHNLLSTHISVEPSDLELTGPTLVEANGQAGRYECRTSGADPPARLAWTLFDRTGQDLTYLLQVSLCMTSSQKQQEVGRGGGEKIPYE